MYLAVSGPAVIRIFSHLTTSIKMYSPPTCLTQPPSSLILIVITITLLSAAGPIVLLQDYTNVSS